MMLKSAQNWGDKWVVRSILERFSPMAYLIPRIWRSRLLAIQVEVIKAQMHTQNCFYLRFCRRYNKRKKPASGSLILIYPSISPSQSAGDALGPYNGIRFTANDRDNSGDGGAHCLVVSDGHPGWYVRKTKTSTLHSFINTKRAMADSDPWYSE
jgi:hypothetical protein